MIGFDYVLMLAQRDTDIREHLLYLYLLATEIDAKTIVEIGAGQSTYALTAAVNKTNGQFYSIDLSSDAKLRLFPQGEGILEKEPRYHFIRGNSVIDSTLLGDSIISKWNKQIDLLFIDSAHTYDVTIKELSGFVKWVRTGGIICLHDTGTNNTVWADCRKALDDFLADKKDKFIHVQYDNQNGFTILKKL